MVDKNLFVFKKMAYAICLLLVLFFHQGCTPPVKTFVKAQSLQNYSGNIGTLNTSQQNLGNVLLLNTRTKRAIFLRKLSVNESDLDKTPTITSTTESFSSELNISFDADIPNAVKVGLSSLLKEGTKLTVFDYSRITVKDPLAVVRGGTSLIEDLKRYAGRNDIVFLFVGSVIPAKSVEMSYEDSKKTDLATNVLKYGDYKFSITYVSNEDLKRVTNQAYAFFRPVPFRISLDQTGTLIISADDQYKENLSEYDFASALE
jgi:hypothetical protein